MERYERQVLMEDIGETGQDLLGKARVLVVGAGGLGSPVLTYLAAAGVGYIRIVDFDHLTESNLNRQTLYGEKSIGSLKVELAKKRLLDLNATINIEAIFHQLTTDNIESMLIDIDVVLDCVDNVATRLIINRACIEKDIPLVEGGVQGFYGSLSIVTRDSACLECMGYKDNRPKATAPVIGVTAGVIGSMQAMECIKMIVGQPSELVGKMVQYDGLKQTMTHIKMEINPKCSVHNR